MAPEELEPRMTALPLALLGTAPWIYTCELDNDQTRCIVCDTVNATPTDT